MLDEAGSPSECVECLERLVGWSLLMRMQKALEYFVDGPISNGRPAAIAPDPPT